MLTARNSWSRSRLSEKETTRNSSPTKVADASPVI